MTDAAEKKAKSSQEAQLKKKELARKKEEQKAEKMDAASQAKAARDKEKLRRQRRGPGMAIVEGALSDILSAEDMYAATLLCLNDRLQASALLLAFSSANETLSIAVCFFLYTHTL